MSINSINGAAGKGGNYISDKYFSGTKKADETKKPEQVTINHDALNEIKRELDTVTISYKDNKTIQGMIAEANQAKENMRQMIEEMIGGAKNGQNPVDKAINWNKPQLSGGQSFWADMTNKGFEKYNISEADIAKAKEMISEDGYFGVNKTTERIVDFAKALAGGNVSEKTIDTLWEAAKKGFENVGKVFGGMDKLPEVSKKTYEAVNTAFQEWKDSIAPKKEAVPKEDNPSGNINED